MTAVVALSIARPDFGPDSGNRLAGPGVDDLHSQHQVCAGLAGTDIAAVVRALDVIRPVDLRRGQQALGGPREVRPSGVSSERGPTCYERLTTGGSDDS